MGLFSRLAGRMVHRREAAVPDEEIRAHVLGEYPPPPPEELPFARQPVPELPEIARAPASGAPRYGEPRYGYEAPEGVGGGMADLRETLAVIEAQLATLRAQVETVNERLKNLEFILRSRAARGY